MVHPEVCECVSWIISARNKPATLEKQTHIHKHSKNRPIGRQNKSPGYHETTPQPKLTLLHSCLYLKTRLLTFLCLENTNEHIYEGKVEGGGCTYSGYRRTFFLDTCLYG